MTNDDQRTIEVSERTYERFEERREESGDEHLPPMDQSSYLSSLLDTAQAVENGLYTDGEGDNEKPGDWRDEIKTRGYESGVDDAETCPVCEAELYHVLGTDEMQCPVCGWSG